MALRGGERLKAWRLQSIHERRPGSGDSFSCSGQERRPGGHGARRRRDARNRTDPGERGFADRVCLRVAVVAERFLRRHDDGLVPVGAGEDFAERVVDRVGEDVGARHQGHPEHDRGAGENGAHLALGKAPQQQPSHQPRLLIGSGTSSALRPARGESGAANRLTAYLPYPRISVLRPYARTRVIGGQRRRASRCVWRPGPAETAWTSSVDPVSLFSSHPTTTTGERR